MFQWPVRVYYEDTDSGGVVYYANYMKFMERARTEWLRSYGVEQDVLAQLHGVIFAVRSISLEYLRPARFNDLLQVSVQLTEKGAASMKFLQQVVATSSSRPRDEAISDQSDVLSGTNQDQNNVLCSGEVRIACLNAATLRPCRIPGQLLTEIVCVS